MNNQTKVNGKKLRLLLSDGFILEFSKLYWIRTSNWEVTKAKIEKSLKEMQWPVCLLWTRTLEQFEFQIVFSVYAETPTWSAILTFKCRRVLPIYNTSQLGHLCLYACYKGSQFHWVKGYVPATLTYKLSQHLTPAEKEIITKQKQKKYIINQYL